MVIAKEEHFSITSESFMLGLSRYHYAARLLDKLSGIAMLILSNLFS
ncbi:hypothetical protein [Psychromonas sp. MB-3u-54]|nr:hypothetical protein [Psychromonas sp. MB-3u-54]